MWSEAIELGNLVETIEYGEPIQSMVWREVFANKKSVRQSEFYQAANVGLKPEIIFEVHSFEFSNDEKVRYKGKEYSIIRAYEKGEITELTVTSYTGSEV
ncbi:MAG: phage head-tail adapter protein [Clostridium lundense]|nr:phage head-tail adapter protein [Clostridium lundense]